MPNLRIPVKFTFAGVLLLLACLLGRMKCSGSILLVTTHQVECHGWRLQCLQFTTTHNGWFAYDTFECGAVVRRRKQLIQRALIQPRVLRLCIVA